ncbi:MAG: hypothetical protein HC907_17880 [Richelia sp. SM1_7_0]|nr:hypothetical protein [Richelia sp. SM1_7_0]
MSKEIAEYVYLKWTEDFEFMSEKLTNLNYLPMANGLLDVVSKELILNEGQALNRNKSIFSYSKTDDDNVNVKIFKEWMETWLCGDREKIDLVISWMSLVCQRQAFKSGSMVGFIGNPGCGKSTIVDFLHGLCEGFSSKPDVSTFTDLSNTHGRALIENKKCFIF